MEKIELLAPAGNFECLIAAVQSGADAVYVSGKAFGARSFADNFDNPQLEKAADYCHIRNTKVYVTVNTLVSDSELVEVSEYLKFLNSIGIDSIIVQDMGILGLAKQIVPDLPVHASTQMTIHNSNGVKFLESQGIKRIVLSRELPLTEIEKISKETDAELEVFCHGALCMCYSGQCLMSSIIGGRSGNRGKCAQPCRLPYSINDKQTKKFYMSLKDLSALEHISKLKEIGVASLKIEGRMKGPAYVAAVTGIYRKYIDNPKTVEESDLGLLDQVFNRGGVTDGYLSGKTGREMFCFDKPDNPYHNGSVKLEQQLLNVIKNENRKISLQGNVKIKMGERPYISAEYNGVFAEIEAGDTVEPAQNVPTTQESVLRQIKKTGGTAFEFSNLNIKIDDGGFVSAGTLNGMRRAVLKQFEDMYIDSFKHRQSKERLVISDDSLVARQSNQGGFVCEVTKIEQFRAVKTEDFVYFYLPIHVIEQNLNEVFQLRDKTVVVLPAILTASDEEDIASRVKKLNEKGFTKILALNMSQIELFKNTEIFGGFRLNIFNTEAIQICKEIGLKMAEVSPELSIKQIEKIKKVVPVQTMVYGRLPIMITENCVIKNAETCPCGKINFISDRLGIKFPVIKDGEKCRNVILNSKKTFLGFDMQKLKRAGVDFFRIYFSDECPEECLKICDSFFRNSGYRPDDFTNGHFFKGVL